MKIAEKYALSKSTVQTIIRSFKNSGSIQNKRGRGRKLLLTNRELRTIVKEVKQSPSLTGQKVAFYVKEMFDKEISGRTIQRTLNRVNLKSRSAVCKPLISKKNLTPRMKFARDHINKDQKFWDNIL